MAAKILRAQVIQIGAVRQGVLSNDINVAAVKMLVLLRLAIMRDKTFAEDNVSRAETSRVGAAKENGVPRHFGINQFALDGVFQQFFAAGGIVAQFPIVHEWRGEHIMAVPIAEPVVALLAVMPVGQP